MRLVETAESGLLLELKFAVTTAGAGGFVCEARAVPSGPDFSGDVLKVFSKRPGRAIPRVETRSRLWLVSNSHYRATISGRGGMILRVETQAGEPLLENSSLRNDYWPWKTQSERAGSDIETGIHAVREKDALLLRFEGRMRVLHPQGIRKRTLHYAISYKFDRSPRIEWNIEITAPSRLGPYRQSKAVALTFLAHTADSRGETLVLAPAVSARKIERNWTTATAKFLPAGQPQRKQIILSVRTPSPVKKP